jgi:hypothetical protein
MMKASGFPNGCARDDGGRAVKWNSVKARRIGCTGPLRHSSKSRRFSPVAKRRTIIESTGAVTLPQLFRRCNETAPDHGRPRPHLERQHHSFIPVSYGPKPLSKNQSPRPWLRIAAIPSVGNSRCVFASCRGTCRSDRLAPSIDPNATYAAMSTTSESVFGATECYGDVSLSRRVP